MCFSENWSLSFGIAGVAISIYRIIYKYKLIAILIPIFYTIMEFTQYFQYKVINKCDNLINQNLTKFTWFLEWIQPLLWNIAYYNITKSNKKVFKFSIVLSLIVFIFGILRVFNTSDKISVTHESQVKGRNCAISGDKHIIWNNNAQTLYGLEPNWFVYLLLWFIPILWITPFNMAKKIFSWQVAGIVLTVIILNIGRNTYDFNYNDQLASTWCLISVPGIILGEFLEKNK
tara:strand:+ start:136 stop:828 length:693 start_codon:yes stop_codon:yes gene_type:complete